ncbi:MAG: 50S ribosomal protein L21, partial [Desulfuromonadales bacterium C00003107]
MYAVIKTGGKQYKVSEGDLLKIEKIEGAVGDTVAMSEVLMVGGEEVKIGTPLL